MLILLTALLSAEPTLPTDHGPWSPAQFRVEGPQTIAPANAGDVTLCGSCHVDVAAQWKTSAHAFSSFNNPIYRVAVEAVRADAGVTASRMCAGCHDVALLPNGGMDTTIDALDARAVAGLSCSTCHSATHATIDGNGSFVTRSDPMLPEEIKEATVANHKRRVASTALRTAEFCGSCHRSFLFEGTGNASPFFGMDDFGAWRTSAYAGSTAERPDTVTQQDCRGCHMKREPAVLGDVAAKKGLIASHRFLGAHTTLAAMRGDANALERQQAFMKDAITIDLAAVKVGTSAWTMPASAASLSAGADVLFEVVLFNDRVGHRFPAGVLDNQGTRVELDVNTANGRKLVAFDQHELRAEVVDKNGKPLHARETNHFVAAVWNQTVPARSARAFRVHVQLPSDLGADELPLSVSARVVHRSRSVEMNAAACADAKSARGQQFAQTTLDAMHQSIDGCAEAPTTVVATTTVKLDGTGTLTFDRAYRRGLALSYGLQEFLDEADEAFAAGQRLASTPDQRAQVLWGRGMIAGRRGQTEAALKLLDAAERAAPGRFTAAIAKARAETYAQVWRWPLAAKAYSVAAAQAPLDLSVWEALSMAEASAGHTAQSLAAAQKCLALQPRDADCLRVQALATGSELALTEALKWRAPDDGPSSKGKCSKNVPGCAALRNPVPVYDLRPATVSADER